MPATVLASFKVRTVVSAVLGVLPAFIFYGILSVKAINVPLEDDYEALLEFVNQMARLRSVPQKFSYLLAAQFNEYKLFFAHGSAWLQFLLLGHINIKVLCAFGNGVILVLAFLLWKMFLPNETRLDRRMMFFVPVPWLLFQLQYAETLNWAMPSLANLPVLLFSLGGIYFLVKETRWAFLWALLCLILSVGSLGNGFLLLPIGTLILAADRRYLRVACWLGVSLGCVAAYAYHFNFSAPRGPVGHSNHLLLERPFYILAFVGNAAAFPVDSRYHRQLVLLSLLLGSILFSFFIFLARKGYIRRNPLVSYCVLYVLLTAVGVAGLRSSLGIGQSLDSRYKVYSALLLIFAWFAIAEELLRHEVDRRRSQTALLVATAGAVLFSLSMDVWGWIYLTERNQKIVTGMTAFEHPSVAGPAAGPILPITDQNARFDEMYRRAPLILRDSIKLGTYRPPAY